MGFEKEPIFFIAWSAAGNMEAKLRRVLKTHVKD